MTHWTEPIHPREILADELEEIGLNIYETAEKIDVSEEQLKLIIEGKSSLNAEVALRLGKFFNTGANFWMNLQQAYDLEIAEVQLGDKLNMITPYEKIK
ncbi:HigA family addiction module antitoxin [Crocosphaera sp.]|uniref:HigA family addiction module antitoxin n=1 Tax=Crocosphaera sp. TaxID=2729996 RepID=UPI002612DBCF|nr:HigA family addiction module antitoxin [Crocosphaera sp.]MDJ0579798.1 HigA family addiction module antitoxin [Crocosphaera sp.]